MPHTENEDRTPQHGAGVPRATRGVVRRALPALTGWEPGARLALPQSGMDRAAKLHLAILAAAIFGIMALGIAVAKFDVLSLEMVDMPATATPNATAPAP